MTYKYYTDENGVRHAEPQYNWLEKLLYKVNGYPIRIYRSVQLLPYIMVENNERPHYHLHIGWLFWEIMFELK